MTEHPNFEQLIVFALDDQADDVVGGLGSHIAACAECGATVARFRLVAETVRLDEALAPPATAMARAKALFGTQPRAAQDAPRDLLAPLRRIVAELIFDSGSGLTPGLAGFRGTGERHLTYVAEAIQVDLRLQPSEERGGAWQVQGQLDADEIQPLATVDVVPQGDELSLARAITDEYGMFAFVLPAGRYDILVQLRDVVRVLPGLLLG